MKVGLAINANAPPRKTALIDLCAPRAQPGVETQRQWSDRAIMRTTPALLGLFSLITLWANDPATAIPRLSKSAGWYYTKTNCTFAAVGRVIWDRQGFLHVPVSPGRDENSPPAMGASR